MDPNRRAGGQSCPQSAVRWSHSGVLPTERSLVDPISSSPLLQDGVVRRPRASVVTEDSSEIRLWSSTHCPGWRSRMYALVAYKVPLFARAQRSVSSRAYDKLTLQIPPARPRLRLQRCSPPWTTRSVVRRVRGPSQSQPPVRLIRAVLSI